VSLAAGGSFTVSFLVTPAAAGTLNNPGTAVCSVDPGNAVNESNEENNTCSNSVTVSVVTGIQKTLTGTNQTFTTGSNVAIGEILTYTVVVNLEAGTYNSAQLVDTMDLGLAFMDCTSITGLGTTPTDFSTACGGPTFNLALSTDPAYHSVATFDLGDLTAASSGGSITFVYRAVVLDSSGNITGKTLSNHAVFHWIDPQEQPQTVAANPTTVTIVEPRSTITKVGDVQFIGVGSIVNFTMTIQNLGNTDAYDVHLTDPIPSQFDLIGSIDCSTTAGSTRDPDFGPLNVAGVITAYWASAQPNPTAFAPGDVGVCKFQLQANATLQPGQQVTNIAYVEWSSLPGDFRQPQIPNDPFSTERFYDPNDPAINNYIANSNTPFNPLGGGGGGGCKNCFRIPQAGFAPGVLTDLSGVPSVAYDDSMGVSLRIPKMNLNMGIVGVPLVNGVWQVDWLTGVGGWLQGTAFPGFSGNSVIMGHVVTHYGSDGPFAHLDRLQAGDLIFVTSFGRQYVYEVRSAGNVAPNDISVLNHADHPVLTLITCSKYNLLTQNYDARFVVRADLVEVDPLR
jgi:LPXTG-site transpeptidase (sortase) family protein